MPAPPQMALMICHGSISGTEGSAQRYASTLNLTYEEQLLPY
ncbi:MAG TPA: hypothetical protein VGJ36_05075 [Gemmatimonadales bacterium]